MFDKRTEFYPRFYSIVSNYAKTIDYKRNNIENLEEFKTQLDQLDSDYSVFFTMQTRRISWAIRQFTTQMLESQFKSIIEVKIWGELKELMLVFENSLRAEIGIFDVQTVSKMADSEDVRRMTDSKSTGLRAYIEKKKLVTRMIYDAIRRHK